MNKQQFAKPEFSTYAIMYWKALACLLLSSFALLVAAQDNDAGNEEYGDDDAPLVVIPPSDNGLGGKAGEIGISGVHAAYYLWYGNPPVDGKWQHWNHEVRAWVGR